MSSELPELEIPDTFKSTLSDFLGDLSNTFPEFSEIWAGLSQKMETDEGFVEIFRHCLGVFPERFFDMLYQNADIFNADSQISTVFLPNMDFKLLFNCNGVTETTKKSMWKYLQLLTFSLIGSVKDKSHFGDSMNMFEGIDEADLQKQMKETMEGIGDFFNNMGSQGAAADASSTSEDGTTPEYTFDKTQGMPNLNDLQEHLKGLFEGKIGSLAKNIAEEISGDFESILGDDYKDVRSTKDIFQKMMKNPKKMMDLVKKVGEKIKTKMDAGDISKDDIMAEAGDILRKMKDMGGGQGEGLEEMLKNMAKNMGMGKNARVDTNALNRMTKQQAMRERILNKVNARKAAPTPVHPPPPPNYLLEQKGDSNFVFKMPEEGEQPRSLLPPPTTKLTDEELVAEFSIGTAPTKTGKSGSSKKKKSKAKK
jgi:hypothetical protein